MNPKVNNNRRIAEAIWPWRRPAPSARDTKPGRILRLLIQVGLMLGTAMLIYFVFHRPWIGSILGGLSLVLLAAGLWLPAVQNAVERFTLRVAALVGQVLTATLLTLFFFICFVPARILLWACGKDPLRRKWQPQSNSYWIAKIPNDDPNRYQSQY